MWGITLPEVKGQTNNKEYRMKAPLIRRNTIKRVFFIISRLFMQGFKIMELFQQAYIHDKHSYSLQTDVQAHIKTY